MKIQQKNGFSTWKIGRKTRISQYSAEYSAKKTWIFRQKNDKNRLKSLKIADFQRFLAIFSGNFALFLLYFHEIHSDLKNKT